MLIKKDLTVRPPEGAAYNKEATLYADSEAEAKSCVLYFHGGGLLYGNRDDLPDYHIEEMTRAGHIVIAYDYPLAPAVRLDGILPDVVASINGHGEQLSECGFSPDLPYFIWGRSAGAYLVLLAAASGRLVKKPSGILSYYGYGFLVDRWYEQKSPYYNSLPAVPESCLDQIPAEPHCVGELETHYSVYVYARQQGKWKDLIYSGREKYFFIDYSLRLKDSLGAPLFCTHSIQDNDVPFAEFNALCAKYPAEKMIAASSEHDFDRDTDDPFTREVLAKTIHFMENHL